MKDAILSGLLDFYDRLPSLILSGGIRASTIARSRSIRASYVEVLLSEKSRHPLDSTAIRVAPFKGIK
ncbi:MAG: hypothetical protein V4521_11095 [Pseudomonadota bacterium]